MWKSRHARMTESNGTDRLSLVHAFGAQSGVQNGALCVDEETVVYSVGRAIALVNTESRAMAFMNEGEKSRLHAMALSPSKKYLALCEGGAAAQVSVWHLASQRRTRALTCADVEFSAYVSAAFSADSKMLCAVGAGADFALVLWMWEKGKMLVAQRLVLPVGRATFNAATGGKGEEPCICTSGAKFLKLWRHSSGQLKGANVGLGKRVEHPNYTDHCFLPSGRDKLVATTDGGDVLIFEEAELKQTLALGSAKLLSVCPCSRGFIVGGADGQLSMCEWRHEHDQWTQSYAFRCTQAATAAAASMLGAGAAGEVSRLPLALESLCVTPSEETLLCGCGSSQLASFPLANIDILKESEHHFHFFAGAGYHHGAITGLDTCVRKPLLATVSTDRTLRLWNYTTKVCEQVKHLQDEPLSCSLHPLGYQVLVGFADKLRYYNVLMDDIRQFADFTLKGCCECRFAHGGARFAAVSGRDRPPPSPALRPAPRPCAPALPPCRSPRRAPTLQSPCNRPR